MNTSAIFFFTSKCNFLGAWLELEYQQRLMTSIESLSGGVLRGNRETCSARVLPFSVITFSDSRGARLNQSKRLAV